MDQPIRFSGTEAQEFRAWFGFWVQLAILVLLAVLGLYFASQGGEPGDYAVGLILAAAAAVLAVLRIRKQLEGGPGGWGAMLLVEDQASLFAAIVLFSVLGLAGLVVAGRHDTVSVQDGGLALFCVCAVLVFLSMKRFFDRQETRH